MVTHKCNGCGCKVERGGVGGFFGYGNASITKGVGGCDGYSQHMKELCPRCTRVLKDILLNSDLSDHWQKYDFDTDESDESTA